MKTLEWSAQQIRRPLDRSTCLGAATRTCRRGRGRGGSRPKGVSVAAAARDRDGRVVAVRDEARPSRLELACRSRRARPPLPSSRLRTLPEPLCQAAVLAGHVGAGSGPGPLDLTAAGVSGRPRPDSKAVAVSFVRRAHRSGRCRIRGVATGSALWPPWPRVSMAPREAHGQAPAPSALNAPRARLCGWAPPTRGQASWLGAKFSTVPGEAALPPGCPPPAAGRRLALAPYLAD